MERKDIIKQLNYVFLNHVKFTAYKDCYIVIKPVSQYISYATFTDKFYTELEYTLERIGVKVTFNNTGTIFWES